MVPQTYPSILNPYTNRHEMVVKQLASTSGLQRWTDYIPVKLSASTRPAGEQTTDGDGFIAINTSQDTSTGVAFKDWVPVYFDNDATDAWVVSASGYIPIGASGGAIAILKSYGSDAHVYLPGAGGVAVSGLLTNNYTLSDGSTGYSAVDGTAGLVLDAMGSVGAELVTNGDNEAALFSLGTMGSQNIAASRVAAIGGRAGFVALAQSNTSTSVAHQYNCANSSMAANTAYLISVDVYVPTGGVSNFRFFDNDDGSFFSPSMTTKDAWITVSCIRQPKATAWTIGLGNNNSDVVTSGTPAFYVDNFSVREVTGIHATQATTANKPALRRGAYNLLTYSEPTSGQWAVAALGTGSVPIVAYGYEVGPLGYGLAARVQLDKGAGGTANDYSQFYSPTTAALSMSGTASLWIKTRDGSTKSVLMRNGAAGQLVTVTGSWQRFSHQQTYSAQSAGIGVRLRGSESTDATADLVVWGAQLETGSTASDYSPTTSAAASNPSAGRYSWQFDGTNDSLALSSVPFQMSDDFLIVGAVRFGNPTSWSTVFSVSGATTTPRIQLFCDNANGFIKAYLRDDAGASVNPGGTVDVRGTSVVATLWKVGTNVYLRVNGVQVATASVSTFGAMALTGASIGRLFNGTDYMSGDMGQVISVKGTFTENDVLTIERLCAANTPSGPSF